MATAAKETKTASVKPAAKKATLAKKPVVKKVAAVPATTAAVKGSFNRSEPTAKGMTPEVAKRIAVGRGLTSDTTPAVKFVAKKRAAPAKPAGNDAIADLVVKKIGGAAAKAALLKRAKDLLADINDAGYSLIITTFASMPQAASLVSTVAVAK